MGRPAFSKHIDTLKVRLEYLRSRVEDVPEDTARPYYKEEAKALEWAIDALEDRLTFPPDVDEMRRAWFTRTRYFSEMSRDYDQFCDFMAWQRQRLYADARED